MRVVISGSSGMIGSALKGSLRADDHDVVSLVRRPAAAPNEITWDPDSGTLDRASLENADAVVNLNGSSIRGRWSKPYKKAILASRTNATRTLAEAIAGLDQPPRVFVSASGIDYYGLEHGSEVLDEEEALGTGFLTRVIEYWEDAAVPASEAGVAVVHPRFGMVMSRRGGSLAEMLPFFRLGLGGALAGGDQYWSPVSLIDAVRALRFVIESRGCSGPYNLTAPQPVTNAEFTRVLAEALNRPTLLPVPAIALQIRYGELAEVILASRRVVPRRLLADGFEFDHPNARSIVKAALR